MANTLRVLLRRAEQGELDGFIYLAACPEGDDKIGLCGSYADDLDGAVATAEAAFSCLLGHKMNIEQGTNKLPRRLRKELPSDQNRPSIFHTRYR